MDVKRRLNDTRPAEPGARPLYAIVTMVAMRPWSILAFLSALYLLWLFQPAYYPYGNLLWLETVAAMMIFCGVLGWAVALYLASGSNGARPPPVVSLAIIFVVSTLLDALTRLYIHLVDPLDIPSLDIRFEVISASSLAYGAAGLFTYAILFRHMHRLTLKNVLIFLFAWHGLISLVSGVFVDLIYSLRSPLTYHLYAPFIYGLFYTGVQVFLVSTGLFTAWWLARGRS